MEELLDLPITATGQLLRKACFSALRPPMQLEANNTYTDSETESEQRPRWVDSDFRHSARYRDRVLEGINLFLGDSEADGTFNTPPSHPYNPATHPDTLIAPITLSPERRTGGRDRGWGREGGKVGVQKLGLTVSDRTLGSVSIA